MLSPFVGNEYLQYLASATLFAGIAAGPNSPATNQSSRIVGTSIATGNRASSAVGISTIAGILPSETALQCTKRKCTRFVVPCSKSWSFLRFILLHSLDTCISVLASLGKPLGVARTIFTRWHEFLRCLCLVRR